MGLDLDLGSEQFLNVGANLVSKCFLHSLLPLFVKVGRVAVVFLVFIVHWLLEFVSVVWHFHWRDVVEFVIKRVLVALVA